MFYIMFKKCLEKIGINSSAEEILQLGDSWNSSEVDKQSIKIEEIASRLGNIGQKLIENYPGKQAEILIEVFDDARLNVPLNNFLLKVIGQNRLPEKNPCFDPSISVCMEGYTIRFLDQNDASRFLTFGAINPCCLSVGPKSTGYQYTLAALFDSNTTFVVIEKAGKVYANILAWKTGQSIVFDTVDITTKRRERSCEPMNQSLLVRLLNDFSRLVVERKKADSITLGIGGQTIKYLTDKARYKLLQKAITTRLQSESLIKLKIILRFTTSQYGNETKEAAALMLSLCDIFQGYGWGLCKTKKPEESVEEIFRLSGENEKHGFDSNKQLLIACSSRQPKECVESLNLYRFFSQQCVNRSAEFNSLLRGDSSAVMKTVCCTGKYEGRS